MTQPHEFRPDGSSQGSELCPNCNSNDVVAVRDLQKCLKCGASWVTGTGISSLQVSSPDRELSQWRELATLVIGQKFPILPQPQWDQDVAFVAFVLDGFAKALADLQDPATLPPQE